MATNGRSILIDGYNLSFGDGTGIATYARNLSLAAHEIGFDVNVLYGPRGFPSDPLLREQAYYSESPIAPPPLSWMDKARRLIRNRPKLIQARKLDLPGTTISRGQIDRLPYSDNILFADSLFDIAAFNYYLYRKIQVVDPGISIDIAHLTYPLPLRVQGAKNICTIHDLVPFRVPNATLGNKERLLSLLRDVTKTFDHIVTVSEISRQDIITLLDVAPGKVTNTWQSVTLPEEALSSPEEVVRQDVEGIYGLPYKGYFLFYGAIEPKKNVTRLIEAYACSGVAAPLVIAGKIGWSADRDIDAIDAFNRIPRPSGATIRRLDYVPRTFLMSLIRGAKAVLVPSLYEGFGLAVLEAMRLGTPVLTSTEGALPEIAADAALVIDPYDIRAMASGLRALDAQEGLRADLVTKGHRRALEFSAEAYQHRLAAVYDKVLSE